MHFRKVVKYCILICTYCSACILHLEKKYLTSEWALSYGTLWTMTPILKHGVWSRACDFCAWEHYDFARRQTMPLSCACTWWRRVAANAKLLASEANCGVVLDCLIQNSIYIYGKVQKEVITSLEKLAECAVLWRAHWNHKWLVAPPELH